MKLSLKKNALLNARENILYVRVLKELVATSSGSLEREGKQNRRAESAPNLILSFYYKQRDKK